MSSLVKAITEFQGEHEGDLPFRHGDLISILEEVDNNWWKGKIGQNVGIFPVSFTREISSQFIATDDFVSDVDGDLPFTRGDIITVIEQIDENWYRGSINGSNGMFPSSFVTEDVQQSVPSSATGQTEQNENLSSDITPSTSVIPHDDSNRTDNDGSHPSNNNSNVSSTQTPAHAATDSPNLKTKKPPISPKPKIDPALLQSKRVRVNQSNVGDVKIKKQHAPPVPTHRQHASSTSALKDNVTLQADTMTGTKEENITKPKRHAPPIPGGRSVSSGVIGLASTQREGNKSTVPPPLLKPKPNIDFTRLNTLKSGTSNTSKESIKAADISNQQKSQLDLNSNQHNVNITNAQDNDDSTTANSAVPMQISSNNIQSNANDDNDKKDGEVHENISQPSAARNDSSDDLTEGANSLSSLWKNWESGKIGAPKKKIPMNQDNRFRAHTIASTSTTPTDGTDTEQSNRLSNTPSSTSIAKKSFVRSSQAAFLVNRSSGVTDKHLETIEDCDSYSPQENDSRQLSEASYGLAAAATSMTENSNVISGHTDDRKSMLNTDNEDHIYESFDAESGNGDTSDDSFADAYDFVYDCNDIENKSDDLENIYEEINSDESTEDAEKDKEQCETIDDVKNKIDQLEKEFDATQENYEQIYAQYECGDTSEAVADAVRNSYSELTDLHSKLGEEHEKLAKLQQKEDEIKEAKLKKHNKVVDELITTEELFLRDLKICQNEVFEPLKEKSLKEINYTVLFNNLDEVIEFAEEFLHNLKSAQTSHSVDDSLAHCFIAHADRMGDVYSRYCKNYSDSLSLLEKYMDDEELAKYLDELLDNARQYTNCLSLESLMIKPVQRVLKYPLLIGELMQTLPESEDTDKEVLRISLESIKSVAKKINEKKRQKELVQKYQSGAGEYVSYTKLPHSIRKNFKRAGMRMMQMTKLAHPTSDGVYNQEVRQFKELESYIRGLIRPIKKYLSQMKENQEACHSLHKTISNLYDGDIESALFRQLLVTLKEFSDVLCPEHVSYIKNRVVYMLNEILLQFSNPQKLIKKCADKKLDVDNLLPKLEKTKDSEKLKSIKDQLQIAEADHNALKSHLLEELPRFSERVVEAVNVAIGCYIWSNKKLAKKMQKLHEMVLVVPSFGDSDQIVNEYVSRATPTIERLSMLSFVPSTFLPTLSRSHVTSNKFKNSKVDRKLSQDNNYPGSGW